MDFKIVPDGSVSSPEGFLASGMNAGIKTSFRKLDVSLIYSEVRAVSAGTFTTNQVKAWPLLHDLKVIKGRSHQVIFANSGNANCFNGESGRRAVEASLSLLSRRFKLSKNQIFLASTGIIGRAFPIGQIRKAIPELVKNLSKAGGHDAARGILTTDTHPKEIAVRFLVDGKRVTLAGMAKGAGMVCPEMNRTGYRSARHATMLCFLTTDLNISKLMLQKALSHAVDKTFNKIVIDNDQSTNDMVLILANGKAKNRKITSDDKRFHRFQEALTYVCAHIAKGLAQDGEGVTHICEVVVKGARTPEEATRLSRQVSSSMLFKTMLAGGDPNWGRVIGSVGASGVQYSPKLDISFDGIPILVNGKERAKNRTRLRQVLKKKEYQLEINLKKGKHSDRFWATDLTKFYVWINASYST
ncbi:MAG: bifunctional glutamate N-acetyltransferase/amino-acid acetyltransferase ArgJ [Candidatus Omnitrophica bacterium]|nr:bifunctional glutamate N-acetyltransferase/amino-acid acetyltransferase ArgJ [Candidatus Omnitrophota bacterium]